MTGDIGNRKHGRGFAHAGGLLASRIRQGAQGRGFAEVRLLTHWEEIVGPDVARIARPGRVSYARGGLGATLSVFCSGADAPVVSMQADTIRERVNACYGYNAVRRVRIEQDGQARGLAEAAAPYRADKPAPAPVFTPDIDNVSDAGLRDALARLAGNVLSGRDVAQTRKDKAHD